MQLNTTNVLLVVLGIILVLCFILMIMDSNNKHSSHSGVYENFDPVIDAIQSNLQNETPEQLKSTIKTIQQRLIDYGYAPDLNTYVKKTELGPDSGKCLVTKAEDRDLYVAKSDVPAPGPRIDLSQYVKKSSIPPAPVCPPAPEIDYSAYVKKSTLPPNEKCPPCIAPKVKVSAGLCRECPPAPVCPPPQRCPEVKCPPPAVCPVQPTCRPCDEIRYIKVPTVITKTVMLDAKGNVISQQISSGNTTPSTPTTTQYLTPYTTSAPTQPVPTMPPAPTMPPMTTQGSLLMPTTTFPMMSITTPNTTLAQTLDSYNSDNTFCPSSDLNSEFKKYGIYGPEYKTK